MKIHNSVDHQLASLYNKEDFMRILENFPEPVCLFAMPDKTLPGRLIYINQKATELLCMTKEDLLSYTWTELFEIPLDKDIDELRKETREQAFNLKESPLKKNLSGSALKVEPHPVQLASGELVMVVTIINITEHYQTQQELKKSEQQFGSLFTHNPDIAISIRMDGRIAAVNKTGLQTLHYLEEEILDHDVKELIAEDTLEFLREHFYQVLQGHPTRFSTKIKTGRESTIDVDVTAIPVVVNEEITGMIGVAHDITNKVAMENLLKENEQRYKALFDYNINPVLTFDLQGRFLKINEAAVKMIDFSLEELVGQSFTKLIDPDRRKESFQNFQMVLDGKPRQYETTIIGKEGQQHLLHVMLIPVWIDGQMTAIHCVCKDITESRRNENLANFMAYHDPLTSLGNQRLFQDDLTRIIQEPHSAHEVSAVLLIDLDRFKFFNDYLGHEIGDRVLCEVADRIVGCVGDASNVYRYAGDEFTVLLEKTSEAAVHAIANGIVEEMQRPLILDSFEAVLTASIGVGLYPKDAQDIKGVMKASDLAMSHAKRMGRNNYQSYNHHIAGLSNNTLEMESMLHKALQLQEFSLHYQPQYRAHDEHLIGFEALLRWYTPQLGHVSPADFIPLAEESGLIVPIGEWVLRKACQTNKKWQLEHQVFIPVSVNLSLRQFYQQDLVQRITDILYETELDPQYLILEITESIAMQEEAAVRILQELRDLGVRIAMDDFGTGYSSFKQLRYFPIHHLKIDQGFIQDLDLDNGEAIVGAMVALGHNLGTEIVAEGVETESQAAALKRLGCDILQGYYYARPQPEDAITELLKNHIEKADK